MEMKKMPLTPEQLVRCKKAWVEQTLGKDLAEAVDPSNLGKKTLILLEGAAHPKTGVKKELVEEHGDWRNNYMLPAIIKEAKTVGVRCTNGVTLSQNATKCLFLQWTCSNRLPVSCRNQNLVPNIVAWTQDKTKWQQCADVQGKQLSEFENWAAREPKPEFNCWQLKKYSEKLGVDYICDACGGIKYGKRKK